MKIKVTKDLCEIKENEIWNVGDYNVHTVQVELSPEFNGLVNKVRYFVEDKSYDMLITDNVAQVPYEATLTEDTIKIGVYGYDADTNILVQSTSPVNKYISSGTYTGDADNTEPLTPTDKEQMETAIQKNTNDITDLKANKQDKLISGVNIKTINNESILSGGNLTLIEEEADPIFTNSPAYSITDNDITYWNNKANMSDIPDVSNFITKDVDDLTYYTKSTDMQIAINNAVGNERTAIQKNADDITDLKANKQDTLISGTNIKTINNTSLLGEGNITIEGGGGGGTSDYTDLTNKPKINNVELNGNKSLNDLGIQPAGNYALESDMTEAQNDIEALQTENERLKATLPTTTGEGQDITLDKTAEMEFVKPPLPMGNSEQNGEPRPDNEVPITNVTGNVEVTISNENNTESKTLPVSLGNIELCKLGDYQDYLYKNNGKWYVHKNTIKIDLSTITSYTHTSGWRNPTAFVADGVFNHGYSGYTTVASLFCNRLIADTPARVTGSVINAIGLGRYSSIYISVEGITTSNALITYFSQNPTYLYAPLATPTSTEITDATLISQLEEISKALSYQGQTNITSNTITMFDVEAYQSTKLILENLDSRLTLVEG